MTSSSKKYEKMSNNNRNLKHNYSISFRDAYDDYLKSKDKIPISNLSEPMPTLQSYLDLFCQTKAYFKSSKTNNLDCPYMFTFLFDEK